MNIVTGDEYDGILELKQHLIQNFQVKDLGWLCYLLGIEIAQSRTWIIIFRIEYAMDVLGETGMLDCEPIDTSMIPNVKLVPNQGVLSIPKKVQKT